MAIHKEKERKFLVVDDDASSIKIVKMALESEGYQVAVASSGHEALEKVKAFRPHLILLDVNMPELNGLETLKYLRAGDEYTAIVFVSARSKTSDVVQGLDAGADDYICKPYDVLELLARVRSQLRIKDLRDELQFANSKLQELIDIDDLTGLFNMRSIYDKLSFELDRGRRYGRSTAVVMLDIDNFKSANDECNHLFGSFVLGEIGTIIAENVRKVDFAARYGGDEFLMVLTEIDFKGALGFAERLRKKIASRIFQGEGFAKQFSVSLGFSLAHPRCVEQTAKSMVKAADQSLYQAKQLGKNRVQFSIFENVTANKYEDQNLRRS